MVLSKKHARKVLEEIIALYPDAVPSLNLLLFYQLRQQMQQLIK